MQKQSEQFFWDAGGKFESARDDAFRICRDCNLSIYSLTAKGAAKPTHLVIKATPIGKPEGYMAKQAHVEMRLLDYNALPANSIKILCMKINALFRFTSVNEASFSAGLGKVNPNCRSFTGQGDDIIHFHYISIADFFALDPCDDEPGAKIYLRDKNFFLSVLPDPQRPSFSELPLLTKEQKIALTTIDLSHADISCYKDEGCVFHGYKNLRELELSSLDTTGFTSMGGMFYGCENLTRLDLSTFDFSCVANMRNMFGNCPMLKEVILPDTFLDVRCIPRTVVIPPARSTPLSREYLSQLYHDVYISEGPQLAELAVERATKDERPTNQTHYIPIREASEDELREYLGLQDNPQTKLTIVPHRSPKK